MAKIQKMIYRFHVSLIKMTKIFLKDLEKYLTIYMETQRDGLAKAVLSKKEICSKHHSTDFKIIPVSHSNKNNMV